LWDNSEEHLQQAVMDRLRSENKALKRRLKEFEECGTRVAAAGNGGELCQERVGSW